MVMPAKANLMNKLSFFLLISAALLPAQQLDFLNHNRPLLDAHNCYPYEGQWADRIERALKQGFPIGIEQDIAWAVDPATGKGRPVVTHTDKTTGKEPVLRDHFFERVRPIIEKALAENNRAAWPIIVLHFDFKSLDPVTLRGVWDLLGDYQDWITTAPQTDDPHKLGAFDAKPLLVLTEDADIQEQIFFREIPKGARLRLFGSAATAKIEGRTLPSVSMPPPRCRPKSCYPQKQPTSAVGGTTGGAKWKKAARPGQGIGRPLLPRGSKRWSITRTARDTGFASIPSMALHPTKIAGGERRTTSARAPRLRRDGKRRSTQASTS